MLLLQGRVEAIRKETPAWLGDPITPWHWGQGVKKRGLWSQKSGLNPGTTSACETMGKLPFSASVSPSVKWV